jgi:DNA-binding response OmpR family regulator
VRFSGETAAPAKPASILVVDDDRRVVELLQVALTANGFRVFTAADGDEGVRVAQRERPDLVVLDVRLPRKSGFDVCETLRRDPEDPDLPIILVSAAAETDARLQGLARGADDYLAKPFSPKELIARIRRLIARASEARAARRRSLQAERELARAREEARRNHQELRHEQRLRELSNTFDRDLHRALDLDEAASRLLGAVQLHLGVGTVVLLGPDRAGEPYGTIAARGEELERVGALRLCPRGPLGQLLHGLARPVRRQELERFPELRDELPPLVAAGISVLAPLRSPAGLEGIVLMDERLDARALTREELQTLTTLSESGAIALFNARRCRELLERVLEALSPAPAAEVVAAHGEAALLLDWAARVAEPSPRQRWLLQRAFGLDARGGAAASLAAAAGGDPTGRLADLARVLEHVTILERDPKRDPLELEPDERRAAALLAMARRFAGARRRGEGLARALDEATAGLEDALGAPALQTLRRQIHRLDGERAA